MRLGRVYRSRRYPLRGGWPGYSITLIICAVIVLTVCTWPGSVFVALALLIRAIPAVQHSATRTNTPTVVSLHPPNA